MAKRPMSRWEVALVVLEVLVSVSALGGGGLLIADPTGAREGMPPVHSYPGMPFASYFVPGLLLFAANGILPLVVAAGTMARKSWASTGHLVVGAVLVVWIAVQVAMIGPVFFLQAVVGGIALAILLLGARVRLDVLPT